MASSALLQTLAFALAVCVACTAAMPPSLLAITDRRIEAPQEEVIDCSPSPDGSPLPAGCRETSQAISYGNPGYRRVVEVVEGAEKVTVVDDENSGTFIIRVPQQQTSRSERCNYLHVYIAELDLCVRAWPHYRYQPRVFQYPSLAALVRPGPRPGPRP